MYAAGGAGDGQGGQPGGDGQSANGNGQGQPADHVTDVDYEEVDGK
jgi:molecular chaperone DnaK